MSGASGRILGLDFGKRRIGLALSDELGITAQGISTLTRNTRSEDFDYLSELIDGRQVSRIVVGYPLNMNGSEGAQARQAAQFGRTLANRCGVEVTMWDERLTTREASRVLGASGVGLRKRQGAIDRLSAVLILQSYLDSLGDAGKVPTS